ncbi:MAG: hypothetical protein IKE24_05920 [Clostridia bacterium]|nr:hypothetical protein [Clostridia bacterium]
MTTKNRKPVQEVVKPFLTGSPTDERTVKGALGFLGVLVLAGFMTFLVCSALNMNSSVLRVGLNLVVEALILLIFYNNAVGRGADAVARGEILYQKQEKGQPFAASEKAICFHPLKGYLTGFLGTIPLLVCAVFLAVTATRQMTGYGALPGWISAYQDRTEVGDALVAYTVREGIGVADVLRIIVRMSVMPFISMAGNEDREALLLVERLSPVIVLLPALAYGTGYLQGRKERTKIHTGIAQSRKNRAKKERKARKARAGRGPRTPQQLN